MSTPFSITLPVLTVFTLTWTLTDASGNPINNAVVTANLYAGRSLRDPVDIPGTLVPPINPVTLNYVAASAGQYSASIPATLNPAPNGVGFVLVISATVSGTAVYHQEVPAIVETVGSNLDLTTVDQVKAYIPGLVPGQASADDALLQRLITAWGFEFLNRTGMGDQNGDLAVSPFTAVNFFNENYDGAGTYRLFLKNRPIVNVASLTINTMQIAQSGSVATQGFVVDGSAKSIALRSGIPGTGAPSPLFYQWQSGPFYAFGGLKFWKGIQNINVQYYAGYKDTPADVVQCSNTVIALSYKRRSWIGEDSRSMAGGGGSVKYAQFDVTPETQLVIDRYTRTL